MTEISKNQVLKNAIEEVTERTGMTKEDILKSIVNDYGDPGKSALDSFTDFLRGGAAKSTVNMEDILPKK